VFDRENSRVIPCTHFCIDIFIGRICLVTLALLTFIVTVFALFEKNNSYTSVTVVRSWCVSMSEEKNVWIWCGHAKMGLALVANRGKRLWRMLDNSETTEHKKIMRKFGARRRRTK